MTMTRSSAEPLDTAALYDINTATLYERLGGFHGIRRIVDVTIAAHFRNPIIKARFEPYLDRPGRVEEIKQQTCIFFSQGSGGPHSYQGRSMADAHQGMDIGEEEYGAAANDLLSPMATLGYTEATRSEVSAMLDALKSDIVDA